MTITRSFGRLRLRRKGPFDFEGPLFLHGIEIPLTGHVVGDEMNLKGDLVRGALRKDGNFRHGWLKHGTYPYEICGDWSEDKHGWLLHCVVGEER